MKYILVEFPDTTDVAAVPVDAEVTVTQGALTIPGKVAATIQAKEPVATLVQHAHQVTGAVIGATGPATP